MSTMIHTVSPSTTVGEPDAPGHEVSSWMTRDPITVGPDEDVEIALSTMLDHGFRHLPVVENGEVIGIVSIRDLAG